MIAVRAFARIFRRPDMDEHWTAYNAGIEGPLTLRSKSVDVTNQVTWEDEYAPLPEPDYQAMLDPKMDLLADVYELLQEVRELDSDPPRGYTTEETLTRFTQRLRELAKDADSLQHDLAVEYESVLGIVEARMRAQLEAED